MNVYGADIAEHLSESDGFLFKLIAKSIIHALSLRPASV